MVHKENFIRNTFMGSYVQLFVGTFDYESNLTVFAAFKRSKNSTEHLVGVLK